MIGESFKSSGIILKYGGKGKWAAIVKFFDAGFCEDKSTEGQLHTRYFVNIETAIDTIVEDATRMGIEFMVNDTGRRCLVGFEYGESADWPMPTGWKQILRDQAERIGYASVYGEDGLE